MKLVQLNIFALFNHLQLYSKAGTRQGKSFQEMWEAKARGLRNLVFVD